MTLSAFLSRIKYRVFTIKYNNAHGARYLIYKVLFMQIFLDAFVEHIVHYIILVPSNDRSIE